MASSQILKSELVYPGRAFTVRRETVRMPNGHETQLDIVEHVGSVVILPMDEAGNILFVRQYRHPTRLDLLELPAGTLNKDEPAETCARREIREETGMAAGKMSLLGGFFLAPGYSTEYMHVFLASDLRPAPLDADEDEDITVERIPLGKALDMAQAGELLDAKSLAAICMAIPFLRGEKA